MGVKRELLEKGTRIISGRVRKENQKWRIMGVYVKGNMEETLQELDKWMGKRKEGIMTVIGGDFNARTGEKGGEIEIKKWGEGKGKRVKKYRRRDRKSQDRKTNKEGRMLIDIIEERGWEILYGSTKGDEIG